MGKIQMIWKIMQTPEYSKIKSSVFLFLLALLQCAERTSLEFEARSYVPKVEVSQDLVYLSTAISLKLVLALLVFFSNIFKFHLISSYYRTVNTKVLNSFLNLKYQSFHKIKLGALQCMLFRRSSAIIELINTVLTRLLPRLFILILSINTVKNQFDLELSAKIAFLLATYFVFMVLIQKKRSNMRRIINCDYEASNTKRLDILMNYEKITTYDNLNCEIKLYAKLLEKHTRSKQIYEVAYDTIGLMSSVYLFYTSYFSIKEISRNGDIQNQEYAVVIVLIENIRRIFYKMLRDIDAVFVSYSNLENSQIDKLDFEPAKKVGGMLDQFKKNIVFENVSVNFGNNRIFDKINLSIEKNKKVAIVGENGVGKSTFIKTFAGLVEYQGSIKIDGVEVQDLSTISRLVSYLPQNISLFNSTISDNLRAGSESISDEKLIDICKAFDCHDTFKEMGYSKPVGEGGKCLSGGQRQKVALLRTIIRSSQVLALDSAFNGLDQASEQSFMKAIAKHLNASTVICVVQNINLLSYFDQILYFGRNSIEFGTFQDLCNKSDSFRNFVK